MCLVAVQGDLLLEGREATAMYHEEVAWREQRGGMPSDVHANTDEHYSTLGPPRLTTLNGRIPIKPHDDEPTSP